MDKKGVGGGRMVRKNNRRTLSEINQNLVQGRPYPFVVNKRVLMSDKPEICEKKHADLGHRPITRRFAAQIVGSQQSYVEKPKNTNPVILNEFANTIAIDDEHKSPIDQSMPMTLESIDPMHTDPHEMEEVEMEDIDREMILDIDSYDANNSLAVVEYIEDLHSYYKQIEFIGCVSPHYMAEQVDLNERMRAVLVDWLIEVHDKFGLMQETLFLTINLIDRFLAKQNVVRKKLQIVGLVALLLACKYEEVDVPLVSDLIHISDKAYTRKDVLDMEKLMLNTLQYNMSLPTTYVFMRRFLKAAQSDKRLERVAFFLVELSLVEYEMLKFPPSLMAAAAVYTAQCTVSGFKHWNKTCKWHTNYSEDQLLECSIKMVGFHQKAGNGKLTGVYRKYSSAKFSFIAKCDPACFLLENNNQTLEESYV